MEDDPILESLLDNEELEKRFLLGNLPEPERAQVEDRVLSDNDFYQKLLITEDDLIDAYARGEMPATERALFEQRYLNSRQRSERLEFAKMLYNSVSSKADTSAPVPEPAQSVSWWRSLSGSLFSGRRSLGFTMAAAVALLIVVLAGAWLLIERARTRPAPEQAQTGQPTPVPPRESPPQIVEAEEPSSNTQKETSQIPARETAKRTTPVIATFTLLPGTVRGESGAQLTLPAGTTEVRLQLGVEGEPYKKYLATLSTPEGRKVWSRRVTDKPSMKSGHLTLSFPANLLKDGDYVLEIGGTNADGKWESVADYSFRVVKK